MEVNSLRSWKLCATHRTLYIRVIRAGSWLKSFVVVSCVNLCV